MDCVCAEELIFMLVKGLAESGKANQCNGLREKAEAVNSERFREEILNMGISRGWADASEVVNPEKPLERKHIAAILHRFIKKELGEKDEDDIFRVQVLKDLYDCHVCVNHIAQVCLKGIMNSLEPDVFGTNGFMSISEAGETVKRVFYPERRHSHFVGGKSHNPKQSLMKSPGKLKLNEALRMAENNADAVIIDVRNGNEYLTYHLKGAVNYPMARLVERYAKDKEAAGGMFTDEWDENRLRNSVCLLYCEAGYQSRVAAECLAEAGFSEVYYFAVKE